MRRSDALFLAVLFVGWLAVCIWLVAVAPLTVVGMIGACALGAAFGYVMWRM